jgi:hypothetical protein
LPHLSAILSLKIASRNIFFKVGGFDFVFSPETRIAPSENALPYDQLASGAIIYAYVNGNPVNLIDPTGEFGLPGAGFGFISGAVGGYISSGGRLDATLFGGVAGALVGLVNPIPGITGVIGGNVGASIVGQMVGNVSTCKPTYDVDLFAAGMAGLGGGVGRGFGQYLSSPTRSASAYIIYRGLGATRPAVQELGESLIEGTVGGIFEGVSSSQSSSSTNCECQK